ncbi:excinuclease ABC subunit C [Litorivivens lipolytica]|uniref:UvrABC system protein C n=1 Tax=Litorivivens lipolytica TaxID=1524264 RepID=A0A7W4W2N5_9GAMM|nr:excinuclease ABC subunit UvrC [Litorivivens lipolytica]MBB3046311.1 excinuclease ABC subunit C [Litorivivens lipolytica]
MSSTSFDHETFLKHVTRKAGVYVMQDVANEILYVGKAKNLRNRLASYFRASGLAAKTMALVERIAHIDVTVTATEGEALLLEQNLIKQYKPPYNILLRDDKSYPYIYLSTQHNYPRITVHRGAKSKQGRYFGPYPNASSVRESLNLLQKVFKVRQCEDSYFANRSRPCLQYQINRCTGPCVNRISAEDYADDVRHTMMFLEGKNASLIAELGDKMEQASEQLAFEEAATYRDQIAHLQKVQASQWIEGEGGDLDIVAAIIRAGQACVQLLYVRAGRILGSRSYYPKLHLEESEAEVLEAFIAQYYLNGIRDLPGELIVNRELPEPDTLVAALREARGQKLVISHRVRAGRAKWLSLAETAAEQNLGNRLATQANFQERYEALQEALELDELPQRLECFDISHSGGELTVASCVVFDGNGPLKSDYRQFNIEGITGGDDYAAMAQALQRRYKRVAAGEYPVPDILLIDGGKGQLNAAKETLAELSLPEFLVVGVAKGVERRAGMEVLIRGDNGKELRLPPNSPALHLIQHVRDESHRFAITAHKNRRDKKRRQSTLDSIPGVGAQRRKALLRQFGGLQGIVAASVEDLSRVPGISRKLAQDIYESLRSE